MYEIAQLSGQTVRRPLRRSADRSGFGIGGRGRIILSSSGAVGLARAGGMTGGTAADNRGDQWWTNTTSAGGCKLPERGGSSSAARRSFAKCERSAARASPYLRCSAAVTVTSVLVLPWLHRGDRPPWRCRWSIRS